jgi:hypothetical protein
MRILTIDHFLTTLHLITGQSYAQAAGVVPQCHLSIFFRQPTGVGVYSQAIQHNLQTAQQSILARALNCPRIARSQMIMYKADFFSCFFSVYLVTLGLSESL